MNVMLDARTSETILPKVSLIHHIPRVEHFPVKETLLFLQLAFINIINNNILWFCMVSITTGLFDYCLSSSLLLVYNAITVKI